MCTYKDAGGGSDLTTVEKLLLVCMHNELANVHMNSYRIYMYEGAWSE